MKLFVVRLRINTPNKQYDIISWAKVKDKETLHKTLAKQVMDDYPDHIKYEINSDEIPVQICKDVADTNP
jgi:hypothetical protein